MLCHSGRCVLQQINGISIHLEHVSVDLPCALSLHGLTKQVRWLIISSDE